MKPGKLSLNQAPHNNNNNQLTGSGHLRAGQANSEGSEGEQSPPMSPLGLSRLSASSSSISSWSSSHSHHSTSASSDEFDDFLCNNTKDTDRSTYNTKFAKFHLDSFRHSDRLRWNFDFDRNTPTQDDSPTHHLSHHSQSHRNLPQLQHLNLDHHSHLGHHSQQQRDKVVAGRYQWEPAI